MKFLLSIIVINFIANLSLEIELSNDFFKQLSSYKYILPPDEKIKNIDTRLLIRISTPNIGLNGKYSFLSNDSILFEAKDNPSFIITKFGDHIQSFNIRSMLLNLKSSWFGLNNIKQIYDLNVICKKNEKNEFFELKNINKPKKDEYLILTFPIEMINIDDEISLLDQQFDQIDINKLLPNKPHVLDFQRSNKINNSVPIKIQDEIINLFLENDNKIDTLPIKDLISSIESKFYYYKEELGDFIKHFFVFNSSLKISTKLSNKITSKFSNKRLMRKTNIHNLKKRDFIQFSDEKPFVDNLVHKTKNIDILMPNNTLLHVVEIDEENLFKNFIGNTTNKSSNISPSMKFNIESFNLYVKKEHHFNIAVYEKLIVGEYIKYLNKHDKSIKNSESKIIQNYEDIYIKLTHSKKKSENETRNNNSNKTKVINITLENITNKTDLSKIGKLDIKPIIKTNENNWNIITNNTHNSSFIYNLTQTQQPLLLKKSPNENLQSVNKMNKIDERKSKFKHAPFLKNEKIKFLNGSLLVVQTFLVGNKDEALGDVKRKFEKILNENKI